MGEAWVMDVLGAARNEARSRGLYRLAEHLDDAILVAASEFHDARLSEGTPSGDGFETGDPVRNAVRPGLH